MSETAATDNPPPSVAVGAALVPHSRAARRLLIDANKVHQLIREGRSRKHIKEVTGAGRKDIDRALAKLEETEPSVVRAFKSNALTRANQIRNKEFYVSFDRVAAPGIFAEFVNDLANGLADMAICNKHMIPFNVYAALRTKAFAADDKLRRVRELALIERRKFERIEPEKKKKLIKDPIVEMAKMLRNERPANDPEANKEEGRRIVSCTPEPTMSLYGSQF